MKRALTLTIIAVLAGALGCAYQFNLFVGVGFFADLYLSFTKFSASIVSKLSFLAKLDPKVVFWLFIVLVFLVFSLLFLLITGIVAFKRKKKSFEEETTGESKPAPNASANVSSNIQGNFPFQAMGGMPMASFNDSTLSEKELDEEFSWRNFVGSKPIFRTIFSIIIGVIFVFFLLLRFFWVLRKPDGTTGIGFADAIFSFKVFNNFMVSLDDISNSVFSGFGMDPLNPSKNFIVGDVLNGNHIYLQQLFEFLAIILMGLLFVLLYLLLAYGVCYLFRKAPAKRRAKSAREAYLADVKNGTAIPLKRNVGYGNTYIYYGQAVLPPGTTLPVASTTPSPSSFPGFVASIPEPTDLAETQTWEDVVRQVETDVTKAEALHGGYNFADSDVKHIAILDQLDENISTVKETIISQYIDDIGEGVKEVELLEEATLATPSPIVIPREPLIEEARIESIFDRDQLDEDLLAYAIKFDFGELAKITSSPLFLSNLLEEDIRDPQVTNIIDFDQDGFATTANELLTKEVIVRGEYEVEEGEPIPGVVDLLLADDDSDLLERPSSLTLIVEPTFELLKKVKILQPEIEVALAIGLSDMVFYLYSLEPLVAEDGFKAADVNECDFQYVQQIQLLEYRYKPKPAELVATEAERARIDKTDPKDLIPVDSVEWPIEDTSIEEVGSLHIVLDGEDKAIFFEGSQKKSFIAPEIYELDGDQIEGSDAVAQVEEDHEGVEEVTESAPIEANQTKALPEGLKPLHAINRDRVPPKIVPLPIKTEAVEKEAEKILAPLAGPLHEITEASKKKDIKPVVINTNVRFNLKRFQTSTYKGNLTPEEAFKLGVTKVSPVVTPLAQGAASEDKVPSWIKSIKERQAKEEGLNNSSFKVAEDISSVWAINSKSELIDRINDVSLRRKKKVEEVEQKPIVRSVDSIKIDRPVAPINLVKPISKASEVKDEPVRIKPLPLPIRTLSSKPKPNKPIKPIAPTRLNAEKDKPE